MGEAEFEPGWTASENRRGQLPIFTHKCCQSRGVVITSEIATNQRAPIHLCYAIPNRSNRFGWFA